MFKPGCRALIALAAIIIAPSLVHAQSPTWEVMAGNLWLHRDSYFTGTIVEDDDPDPLLLGGDLATTNFMPGFVTQLKANFGVHSVIARYFQVDGWTQTAAVNTGGEGAWMEGSSRGDASISAMTAVFSSDLRSTEILLGHQVTEWLLFTGGFRWIGINEQLHIDFEAAGSDFSNFDGFLKNNLYGFQAGTLALLFDGGGFFTLTGDAKGGIYGVDVRYNAAYDDGTFAGVSGFAPSTAFVGEIGILSNFYLTPNIQFNAGYHLLWITGIGLVTQQPSEVAWATGDGVNASGAAFYHGASANLTFLY